jgi:hypothetical protein
LAPSFRSLSLSWERRISIWKGRKRCSPFPWREDRAWGIALGRGYALRCGKGKMKRMTGRTPSLMGNERERTGECFTDVLKQGNGADGERRERRVVRNKRKKRAPCTTTHDQIFKRKIFLASAQRDVDAAKKERKKEKKKRLTLFPSTLHSIVSYTPRIQGAIMLPPCLGISIRNPLLSPLQCRPQTVEKQTIISAL